MAERRLTDPDIRRLRALRMIEMRIKGKTYKEIAKEFGLSENTVQKTLTWAKKAQIVVEAEDRILKELVPAAHTALLKALNGDNADVATKAALEIFKGTLPSFSKGKSSNGPVTSDSGSLSSYIDSIRNDLLAEGEIVGRDAPGVSIAITDGVERSPQRQITAGAQETPSEGVSAPASSDGCASIEARDEADSE